MANTYRVFGSDAGGNKGEWEADSPAHAVMIMLRSKGRAAEVDPHRGDHGEVLVLRARESTFDVIPGHVNADAPENAEEADIIQIPSRLVQTRREEARWMQLRYLRAFEGQSVRIEATDHTEGMRVRVGETLNYLVLPAPGDIYYYVFTGPGGQSKFQGQCTGLDGAAEFAEYVQQNRTDKIRDDLAKVDKLDENFHSSRVS